jgi:hypothetical protein
MAANGLMYTASFSNVSITNAAQNIWEIIGGASCSVLIHSIRLTVTPTITSGVAQDVRMNLNFQRISTTGTGGSATTPAPVNPRNTIAATTTFNRLVTTPGTASTVLDSENVSIIVPYERIYTPDQRIPLASSGAGTSLYRIALNLSAGLGGAFNASSEIYFEEI